MEKTNTRRTRKPKFIEVAFSMRSLVRVEVEAKFRVEISVALKKLLKIENLLSPRGETREGK